jgi:hypothetical protein
LILDLVIALLAAFSGAFAMLWLLLLWLGDGASDPVTTHAGDPITGPRDQIGIHDSYEPFIPMPARLQTRNEMVDWMTKELPKLTAALPKSQG